MFYIHEKNITEEAHDIGQNWYLQFSRLSSHTAYTRISLLPTSYFVHTPYIYKSADADFWLTLFSVWTNNISDSLHSIKVDVYINIWRCGICYLNWNAILLHLCTLANTHSHSIHTWVHFLWNILDNTKNQNSNRTFDNIFIFMYIYESTESYIYKKNIVNLIVFLSIMASFFFLFAIERRSTVDWTRMRCKEERDEAKKIGKKRFGYVLPSSFFIIIIRFSIMVSCWFLL